MGMNEVCGQGAACDVGNDILHDPDFLRAYAAAAQLVGTCLAYAPKDDAAMCALSALREMDIAADWPFDCQAGNKGERPESLAARAAGCIALGKRENGAALSEEYQRLFIGPGHLNAPPWGSVYMDRDKVLYGCTWVQLRSWMRENGIVSEYEERVPEDQIGRILVMSAEVATEKPDALPELLGQHILPWACHYFDLLAEESALVTYKGLALLGKATLCGAAEALRIAPVKKRLFM